MNEPAISIILPSLNVVEYIEEALESVVLQSLSNLEIICVDAGSVDGTTEIINRYVEKDSRVKLILSEKKSYGYQVNLGLREAKGKYIAILETDDFVDVDMYKILYEAAESNVVDYVKCDYIAFVSQIDGSYYSFSRHSFTNLNYYNNVLCPRENTIIGRDDWYLWQGIYSAEFIRKHNISFSETPGAAFQDIGFLFWTGYYADRALYLRDTLYHYRLDRDGASSNLGKGLAFAKTEYSLIQVKLDTLNIYDNSAYKLLYARMTKSFVSLYSRLDNNVIPKEEVNAIYEWFNNEIKYALENNFIDDSLILDGHKDKLNRLLESQEAFFEKYINDDFIKYLNAGKTFVIFGCGDFGYRAYKKLIGLEKSIICFLDNDKSLWGKKLNGISICDPKEVLSLDEEIGIIIANDAHHREISQQLIEYGINPDRLYVVQ